MARCKFCQKSVVWREVFNASDELVWRTFDKKPQRAANVPVFVIHTCREKEKATAEHRDRKIPDDPWWNR